MEGIDRFKNCLEIAVTRPSNHRNWQDEKLWKLKVTLISIFEVRKWQGKLFRNILWKLLKALGTFPVRNVLKFWKQFLSQIKFGRTPLNVRCSDIFSLASKLRSLGGNSFLWLLWGEAGNYKNGISVTFFR